MRDSRTGRSSATGTAVTTYTFDANGNTTLENTAGALTTYTWDGEDRLTQVAAPTETASSNVSDWKDGTTCTTT